MSTNDNKTMVDKTVGHNSKKKSSWYTNITAEAIDLLPPEKAKAMLKEALKQHRKLNNQNNSKRTKPATTFEQKDANYFGSLFYSSPVSKTVYGLNQKNKLFLIEMDFH
jgi:hypothetical protein